MVTETIVSFIKDMLRAIREGFRSITIYKNSNGRNILSIGKLEIPLLSENEMRISLSLVVILISTLAGEDAPIGEFKELEIILYNIFITTFFKNPTSK